MGAIKDEYDTVYRDYATDGVAASGLHEPVKSAIRYLAVLIESALGLVGLGGMLA